MTPAQARRGEFTKSTGAQIATMQGDLAALIKHADHMLTAGRPMGRTERWKEACAYAGRTILELADSGSLTPETAQSTLIQGHIFMAHNYE
jgi:hypothetical protein